MKIPHKWHFGKNKRFINFALSRKIVWLFGNKNRLLYYHVKGDSLSKIMASRKVYFCDTITFKGMIFFLAVSHFQGIIQGKYNSSCLT